MAEKSDSNVLEAEVRDAVWFVNMKRAIGTQELEIGSVNEVSPEVPPPERLAATPTPVSGPRVWNSVNPDCWWMAPAKLSVMRL